MKIRPIPRAAILAVGGAFAIAPWSTSAQAKTNDPVCERPANSLQISNVYFEEARSNIDAGIGKATVDLLVEVLEDNEDFLEKVVLVGHSASTEQERAVNALSELRANALRDALVARGFPVALFETVPSGVRCEQSKRPIDRIPQGWPNQRVEVFLVLDMDEVGE